MTIEIILLILAVTFYITLVTSIPISENKPKNSLLSSLGLTLIIFTIPAIILGLTLNN